VCSPLTIVARRDTGNEHCRSPFEPRKGSGGKPQIYCSAECRKASRANVPNHPNAADIGKDIGNDIGTKPPALPGPGARCSRFRLEHRRFGRATAAAHDRDLFQ
jgi:hypothetical protein